MKIAPSSRRLKVDGDDYDDDDYRYDHSADADVGQGL